MKYPLLIILAVLIGLAFQLRNHATQTNEQSLQRTLAGIPTAMPEPEESKDSGDALDSAFSGDPKLNQAIATVRELSECLAKDLCGQKRDPEHPYFDPHHTGAHRKLNHALKFLKALADEDKLGLNSLTKEDLKKTLAVQNEDTQILSVQLWPHLGLKTADVEELLKHADTMMERALPQYYGTLLKETAHVPDDKRQVMSSLNRLLEGDKINSIYEVAAHLQMIHPSKDDFRDLVQSVCHIQKDPQVEHNWKMIRYQLQIYSRAHGYEANIDAAC